MLVIKKEVIEKIKKEGEEGYPYEICGFLIGSIDFEKNRREVVVSYQAENQNKERANDRFEIDPSDYIRVEKFAQSKGLEIVGIYHSHPDHPDRPSQTDLRFAQPDMSYIILSVKNGKAESWSSYELIGDHFEKEEVKTI